MTELIIGGSVIAAVLGLMGIVHRSNCVNETKVNRLYQRLDDVKDTHDERYQAKILSEEKEAQVLSDKQAFRTANNLSLIEVENEKLGETI